MTSRIAIWAAVAVVVTSGVGVGLALSFAGASPAAGPSVSRPFPSVPSSTYDYYLATMKRYRITSKTGAAYGWMLRPSGWAWMVGGVLAPGWMRGGALPRFMMGTAIDAGQVIGELFADAPGPRASLAQAVRLGGEVPQGGVVDATGNQITFSERNVRFVVVASPSPSAGSFRIAGMTDPTVVVDAGASVTVELVNAFKDMAQGLVVVGGDAASQWTPMHANTPAFPAAAVWFLGGRTAAGLQGAVLTFTASTPGTYVYLCPLPGHAAEGMVGTLIVRR